MTDTDDTAKPEDADASAKASDESAEQPNAAAEAPAKAVSEASGDDDRDSDPDADGPDSSPAHAAPAPSADSHGDAHAEHGHGLAHVMPVSLLVGILAALLVLTIFTVTVTHYDLGSEGNLVVALVVATIKAGLVVAFFMHLAWDRRFNLLAFLSAVLFLILFLSLAVTDRSEYQPQVDQFLQQQAKTP